MGDPEVSSLAEQVNEMKIADNDYTRLASKDNARPAKKPESEMTEEEKKALEQRRKEAKIRAKARKAEKRNLVQKERAEDFTRAQRYLGLRPSTPGGKFSQFIPLF